MVFFAVVSDCLQFLHRSFLTEIRDSNRPRLTPLPITIHPHRPLPLPTPHLNSLANGYFSRQRFHQIIDFVDGTRESRSCRSESRCRC